MKLLPPATEALWAWLKDEPSLGGFVLIGGSALALHLNHRLSEDLDFAYPNSQLPTERLELLRRTALAKGFNLERNDDAAVLEEFLRGGQELHDYQQDFLANGVVKVSFFTADAALSKVLKSDDGPKPRLASLLELFKAKSLVTALRSKTRDWLDLYLLLREKGFTIQDFADAFREAGISGQAEVALMRLCSGKPQLGDEGYAHLLEKPPSLAEMQEFFCLQRDLLEIDLAAKAARRRFAGWVNHRP